MNVVYGLSVIIMLIAIAKWYNWTQMKHWYDPEDKEDPQSNGKRSGRL